MTKARSAAKQRIIDVAFEHFVQSGYEGASLADIAESVGIRKASIYTHFKSKDALFLELLKDALDTESAYVHTCFEVSKVDKLPGERYLREIQTRYEKAVTYQFLTRIAYVPPRHLIEHVTSAYQQYIEHIVQCYQPILFEMITDLQDRVTYTDAYLGILDSLSVELLYDGRMYQRRLSAMLHLYQQGLQNASN